MLANKNRWYWLAFLFLSPLAYLVGGYIIVRYDPISQIGFKYDREMAVEIAQGFALERGLEVRGWEHFLSARADNSRYFYYRLKAGPATERLRSLVPAVTTRVLLVSPDGRGNIQVYLSPGGKTLGFRRLVPASEPRPDPGAEAARNLAITTLSHWFTADEIARFEPPEQVEDTSGSTIIRRYKWKIPLAPVSELGLSYETVIRGDQVISEVTSAQVNKDYQRRAIYGGATFSISTSEVSVAGLISLILYYLVIFVVFIIGFYRFIQRARQRELSYQRIALLTLLIAGLFLAIILLTDVATYDAFANTNIPSIWIIYIFGTIGYLVMGLVVAIAYGGGEGDLREGFPGKLTSLDALLKGRLFSRNVARAVVIGCAFGGWGLLAFNSIQLLWRDDPTAGRQIETLDFIIGRLPWMSPLVIWPFDIIFTAVVGLLLPLPFLKRRIRHPKVVLVALAGLAWIAGTGAASFFTPWLGAALMGAVKAALLIIPFLVFDLLTALVSLAGPTFVMAAIHLTAQPVPALQRAGYLSFGIAGGILLFEFYFVYRGRSYREEEVRPLYARLLAERLSMQAEVSAAREAQVRLLPESLPHHRRLTIAAECRPAHEVGGDFFEVFELDEDRIGIFMAEGGGRGLASALSIAYAKGFLLPKIGGDSKGDDSPTEIVRSLQSQLNRTMGGEAEMGLAYVVIDTADQRIRYARTGVYPRVFVGRPSKGAGLRTPDEQEMLFQITQRGANDNFTVISGAADLEPGEQIVMLTDGVATALADGKGPVAVDLGVRLAEIEARRPEDLKKALQVLLDVAGKNAQRLGITDDLTAMIVRINSDNGPEMSVKSGPDAEVTS